MVKVNAPMMSLSASGTLGDAITFSSWKGRSYVRERVIPSNPRSGGQVGRRSMFAFLTQKWDALATVDKATWQDLADQLVASPFNAFVSDNMEGWHNFLTPTQATPATRTGTPSDNALTAAVWEENRVKLSIAGTALGDAWGLAIFAATGATVTPSVGNCVLAVIDDTIAAHDVFWTPPTVEQYTFDTIAFADDGAQAAAGGPESATP